MPISPEIIDALLPQTQCGECGFKGCRPYAEALAQGSAPIDNCPPGGVETVKALAALLGKDPKPDLEKIQALYRPPSLAVIRESECIGCTKCIQACPVDAIVGARQLMHVVLTTDCTGCGLCVDPCPVDCIDMVKIDKLAYDKERAKMQYQAKQERILREVHEKAKAYREKKKGAVKTVSEEEAKKAKQAYILQALARKVAKHHE